MEVGVIGREQVRKVLTEWQTGERIELSVWQWGEQAHEQIKQQVSCEDELVRDIVDLLASLPYEMLVIEDIPVLLDALSNPIDETDLSINLVWNYMDGVDVDGRRIVYAEHEFYGHFNGVD